MRALPALLAALLAGCASPGARFYTLSSAPLPAAWSSGLSVAVGPVSVPAAVDRPEIVVSVGPNRVRIEEYERWASPLQDELSRAVAENLAAILATPHVVQSPPTLAGDGAYRVAIEVQRFDSVPGESAALDALWTVRRPHDERTRSGRTTVRERASGSGYDALAAAHSRAVAQLGRDIAEALRAFERAAP